MHLFLALSQRKNSGSETGGKQWPATSDSDNGSEVLNHHLVTYCKAQSIQFTRGRPYKKDDNAHIEQKNWTHVPRLIGWDR